jgi:radical SAM superfamily enzyme YgiQ (UPF0313 family)
MSNLGFHALYHRLASFRGIRVFRYLLGAGRGSPKGRLFCPELLDPGMSGRDADSSLARSDVILFTISFEPDYVNLIRMLLCAGIPPLRRERDLSHPLVVAGGVTVTANPDILRRIVDVVYRGDMECGIDRMLGALKETPRAGRESTLAALGEIEGVLVTGAEKPAPERAVLQEITDPACTVILTKSTEFANMFLVEIARGCGHTCRFCMTRCVNNPLRVVDPERIVRAVSAAEGRTGRVGLVAPVLTDHPGLADIVRSLNGRGFQVSFSSLRADDFTPDTAQLLEMNGQSTVTFAPETGSVNLRRRMGKTLTDEALLAAVALARDHGVRRVRYYLMYGLPGEERGDIDAVVPLVGKTMAILGKNCSLTLSVNPFVPKRQTPEAGHRPYPRSYYASTMARMKSALEGMEGVELRFASPRNFFLQYGLSVGDEGTGEELGLAVERGRLGQFARRLDSLMERDHAR